MTETTLVISGAFAIIILTEYLTRGICPNSYLRPSNSLNKVAPFIGNCLYYVGNNLAFLLDYMTYIHILRFIKNILINIGKYLQKIFNNIEYYLRIILNNV
jgi:hypothetical protein